jgi:hypothetical protein
MLLSKDIKVSNYELWTKISKSTSISDKIDMLAERLLVPAAEPWYRPIIVVAAGACTYVISLIFFQNFLPRLTPNSVIAVGLAGKRAARYGNMWKFAVVTILITGVLLPLVRELIKSLF